MRAAGRLSANRCELMETADLLLIVDAPARLSVFLPSKLVDYLGARRPILSLTPEGAARRVTREAGFWAASAGRHRGCRGRRYSRRWRAVSGGAACVAATSRPTPSRRRAAALAARLADVDARLHGGNELHAVPHRHPRGAPAARVRSVEWTGSRRRIAIDLIDDIDRLGAPEAREALFERIVDARGAFKRTYRDRFADFDARLIEAWRAAPPATLRRARSRCRRCPTARRRCRWSAAVRPGEWRRDFKFTATDLDGRYVKLVESEAPGAAGDPERSRRDRADHRAAVPVHAPRKPAICFHVNRMLRPAAERFADCADRGLEAGCGRRDVLGNPVCSIRIFGDCVESDPPGDVPRVGHPGAVDGRDGALRQGDERSQSRVFRSGQMRLAVGNLFGALADGGRIRGRLERGRGHCGRWCRSAGAAGERLVVLATLGAGFRAPDALRHASADAADARPLVCARPSRYHARGRQRGGQCSRPEGASHRGVGHCSRRGR